MTMRIRPAAWAGLVLSGVLATAMLAFAPSRSAAQVVNGFDVFQANCDGCHELYDPADARTKEIVAAKGGWAAVLDDMVKNRGAALTKQEFTAVLNYLNSFNQVRKQISWNLEALKAHKLAFDPKLAGKLPEGWVSVATGGGDSLWSIQSDTTGKLTFFTPVQGVGENQFALLMNNGGVMKDGSVSTRFRVVSSKTQFPGAGIVFGFNGTQTMYGARISPKSNDLLLFEIDTNGRALLGKAPAPVKAGEWATLGVNITGKKAEITLNGKPVLTRELEKYRGGHVGVLTQADTIAWFDQWNAAVK